MMDRVDECALDPWISSALVSHLQNHDSNTSDQIQEVTSNGYCHVWNVKIFDEPIGGMLGMCDIDDSQLFIKALFTEDSVKTFEGNEALVTCSGFCDIYNSIMKLKKYHIMMDVTPQIEQCQLAICVDEFLIQSYQRSPPCRDSLNEAVLYPTIARHIRQLWRAKYDSDDQDSCSSNVFSESISQEEDALSQLLELITTASQTVTSCSETDQRTDQQRPHRGYYELDEADYNQGSTLSSSEVLNKVIEDVENRVRHIEDAEFVKSTIPETVERGLGSRVYSVPAKELESLAMGVIDPAEYDTPDAIMQILDNMEKWKVGYVSPGSERAVGSSSIDITSFNTRPSVEHHKKDGEEQAQESVASKRCKRKIAFSPRSQSHCKMAKSSNGNGRKIIQDQDQIASKHHDLNKHLERIRLQSVPQPEIKTDFQEDNSESVEGLTQLCDCLTPCEESEDEIDAAGCQRERSSAYNSSDSLLGNGQESKRKSQKPCVKEKEQSNRIGIIESEIPQEEWMISRDRRRQSLNGDSFSDNSSTSESLLLSCEMNEPLFNEKQDMNKEQLEDLTDTSTNSDNSTEFVDCTQLEMVPSVSGQQPKSCPKEQSQQHFNFQASPTSKLVHTSTQSFQAAQHTSYKTSHMFIDAHTQTSDTSSQTSYIFNVAQISKVDKTNLKETKLPSTSSTSSTSSNARPLDKPSRPVKTFKSSSLIASMCSLKMCGSDWIAKSLPSLTQCQSRLKETSAIAKSSKRRSTEGTTDGDDLASRLKNYKLENQTLEWCASIACSIVKTTNSQGAPTLTGH